MAYLIICQYVIYIYDILSHYLTNNYIFPFLTSSLISFFTLSSSVSLLDWLKWIPIRKVVFPSLINSIGTSALSGCLLVSSICSPFRRSPERLFQMAMFGKAFAGILRMSQLPAVSSSCLTRRAP